MSGQTLLVRNPNGEAMHCFANLHQQLHLSSCLRHASTLLVNCLYLCIASFQDPYESAVNTDVPAEEVQAEVAATMEPELVMDLEGELDSAIKRLRGALGTQ